MITTLPLSPIVPAVLVEHMYHAQANEILFNDVSLSITNGSFTALIGPNGGGKTTLLRLLAGLLAPRKGNISIFGHPSKKMSHCIGYVPQYTTIHPHFPASVLEMVLMGHAQAKFWGRLWNTDKQSKEKACGLLETLGILHKKDKLISTLSGGEMQRILVARALMAKPENTESPFLLLLDEPTASIDPEGKHCFYDFLNTLRGKCTIIMVSHDFLLNSPYFSSIFLINKSIAELPKGKITPEILEMVFGVHADDCPMITTLKTAFL